MRLLALIILLAAAPASADLFDVLGIGIYVTKATDIATTELALGRPGVYEANPLLHNRGVRVAASAVVAPLINLGTARVYRTRPRLALWMRVGVVVGWGFASAHHLRVGR